jgi:hypothetical protein
MSNVKIIEANLQRPRCPTVGTSDGMSFVPGSSSARAFGRRDSKIIFKKLTKPHFFPHFTSRKKIDDGKVPPLSSSLLLSNGD